MATIIRQIESIPATYPDPPPLSEAAAALDWNAIWQRVESYIAWRWTQRQVTWIVDGCGEFVPPLTPVVSMTTIEVWSAANVWEASEGVASPTGGYHLRASGPYRFTALVGEAPTIVLNEDDEVTAIIPAPVPDVVNEAVRRLAEHLAAGAQHDPAIRSESLGDASTSFRYSWRANALQDSGAADLLRQFRRA